jgi:pimeloyl-ACP methyl ester carboxylesterase
VTRLVLLVCAALLAGTTGADARTTILLAPGTGYRGADAYDGGRMSVGERWWRKWGFRVHVVPYGPGKAGREDVAAAARAAVRRGGRVCLYGESSGGTWALDAAATVDGVDCVMTGGAPTDEDTWRLAKRGPAYTFSHRIWPAFFGTGRADNAYEPFDVWRARRPDVPAFVVVAGNDPTVPPSQGRVMAKLPGVRLRVLSAGVWPYVHSRVSRRGVARVRMALRRFARG